VTATSEAPASFRRRRHVPVRCPRRGGIREVLSRRRLIAYPCEPTRKTGSDTLLGNVWWFLDPLLQMLVYVIFVGIILRAGRRLPAVRAVAILP
jgi:ABC-type polysaccharide/polyol phosphate export permease